MHKYMFHFMHKCILINNKEIKALLIRLLLQ